MLESLMASKVFLIFGIIMAVILGVVILLSCYKKVRPNEVMIITGAFLKGKPKVVKGAGAVVIPLLQAYNVLDLSSFTLPLKVESNTLTQVPLIVEGTATLNLGSDEVMINTSARKFLGVTEEERNGQLSEIVRGQVRGILGTMRPEDISNKKSTFSELIIKDLQPLLSDMGVEVVSVQINDVYDENGYIKSLYAEDVAEKRAEAEISEANANRRAREAKAKQDQLAQEAEQLASRNVAEKQKETNIAKAEFKQEEDAKNAAADQAYPLAEAEASKRVIETQGEAKAIQAERDAEVARQEVAVAEQRLKAEVIAQTNANTEALRIQAQAESDTARIRAEADRFSREQDAEASAFKVKQDGEANAEAESAKISKVGKAKAESISAVGTAEAHVKELMAKALANEGQAVLQQLLIEQLPQIAAALVKPMESIDNLTVFNGTQGMVEGSVESFTQTLEFVKQSSGIDLKDMLQKRAAGTVTVEGDPIVQIGTDMSAQSLNE